MLLSRAVTVAVAAGRRCASSYAYLAGLTEEHNMLRESCRRFAEQQLMPKAAEWDLKHQYPAEGVSVSAAACTARCGGWKTQWRAFEDWSRGETAGGVGKSFW